MDADNVRMIPPRAFFFGWMPMKLVGRLVNQLAYGKTYQVSYHMDLIMVMHPYEPVKWYGGGSMMGISLPRAKFFDELRVTGYTVFGVTRYATDNTTSNESLPLRVGLDSG